MSFGRASSQLFWIDRTTQIQKVDQHKVLGFWLEDNLRFSPHQLKASKAAYRMLHLIKRSFPIITIDDFHFLYGTYVRPHLEYGSQIVYTGLAKDRDLLERVQRRVTKFVKGLKNLSYPSRLLKLNLYPLDTRRIRGDLFLVYPLFSTGIA